MSSHPQTKPSPIVFISYAHESDALCVAVRTLAVAIMDRLVHNAYKLNLTGESLRKKRANLTATNEIE